MKKEIKSPYSNDLPQYIKPENRMNKEEMKKLMGDGTNKPIIMMEEGKTMPLFINFLEIESTENKTNRVNIMTVIMHDIEKEEIETKGRMRDGITGEKKEFSGKTGKIKYDKENYEIEKAHIRELNESMKKDKKVKVLICQELEFDEKDGAKEVARKMEQSNLFNIGREDKE